MFKGSTSGERQPGRWQSLVLSSVRHETLQKSQIELESLLCGNVVALVLEDQPTADGWIYDLEGLFRPELFLLIPFDKSECKGQCLPC